jgi:hypothetical protein
VTHLPGAGAMAEHEGADDRLFRGVHF